jgi:hypothetical protein
MNFFSIRIDAWYALARAVILALIVWFLWPAASAQTLGLSSNDIATVNRLGTEALKHSSSVLNANRDLENTRFEEGAFGQVLKSLNVSVGAGVGASDPFEQANVRGSVTVSVNLSSLTANLTAPAKSPAQAVAMHNSQWPESTPMAASTRALERLEKFQIRLYPQ